MKYILITLVLFCGSSSAQNLPVFTPEQSIDKIYQNNASFAPCSQITEGSFEQSFGTNFENFVMADNYNVAAGTSASIQTLIVNILTPQGNDIASADIKIHADVSGFPGAVLEFFDNIVPSGQIVVQESTNGNDFHQVTFDLSSAALELSGGGSGAQYWIALNTTATVGNDNEFWESTTNITNGQALFSVNGGATWVPLVFEDEPYELIMTVESDCILSNESNVLDRILKVFPNPSTGIIKFEGFSMNNVQVRIQDGIGRTLETQSTVQNSLDLTNLPSGIYFISFKLDDRFYSKKIIIQ